MQNKWHEHSVGNIVVNFPLSSAIFRAAGIDYCCGGGRLLGEVIKEQRLVDSNIYKALDELAARTDIFSLFLSSIYIRTNTRGIWYGMIRATVSRQIVNKIM